MIEEESGKRGKRKHGERSGGDREGVGRNGGDRGGVGRNGGGRGGVGRNGGDRGGVEWSGVDDGWHMSLSRTVVVLHHWMDVMIEELKRNLTGCSR